MLQAMKIKLNFHVIRSSAIGAVWVKIIVTALEQNKPTANPMARFLVGRISAAYAYGDAEIVPKKNIKSITMAMPPLPQPINITSELLSGDHGDISLTFLASFCEFSRTKSKQCKTY